MEQNNIANSISLEIAKERVRRIKKFYNHLFVFLIGATLFISKTYFGAPLNFFPVRYLNSTFMYCWTFILVVQGVKLFVIQNLLGKDWERNQIQKILDKENKNN